MARYLADTMAVVSHFANRRLGRQAAQLFHEAASRINSSTNYAILPLDANVVLATADIDDVRELHDRMIAATAKYHGLSLVTNDHVLSKSKHVTTVW